MPFFQIDDQLPVNRKAQALARTALRGDLSGLAALGLWTEAGASSQASLSDGMVSVEDLVAIVLNFEVVQMLAEKLVDVGLWHGTGHDCERCRPVPDGHYLFHDWFSLGYDRGDQVRTTRDKRKELKDQALIAAVWARDCIDDPANPAVGLCRYCAREVHRQDRKSDTRPTMDHVDPRKAVGATNVVLACADCNRRKSNRTPEQAGMVLRPAPARNGAAAPVEPVSPSKAAETPAPAPQQPTHPVEQALAGIAGPDKGTENIPADIPARIRPEDQSDIRPGSDQISDEKGLSVRAHAGTRRGRAGQGGVNSSGLDRAPQGQPASDASPSRSRNRRRRGKKKPSPSQVTPAAAAPAQQTPAASQPQPNPAHFAGEAPAVPTPGRFGSPWHGWAGRPSGVTETTCPTHQMEEPCRRCQQESV